MRTSTSLAALCLLSGCVGAPRTDLGELPVQDVSRCDTPRLEGVAHLGVAIAIDASRSTANPSLADIDGDGRIGAIENSVMTDPADSLLSAEVAGIRSLLHALEGTGAQLSIVAFAGRLRHPAQDPGIGLVLPAQAVVVSPLTRDLGALEAGLGRVLERGAFGTTQFSAGMRVALRTLAEAPDPASRRSVLLVSDSPHPFLVGASEDRLPRGDPLMELAARRAIDAHVRIHTFGLGTAATAATPHSLSRIAGATGGTFQAVPDPTRLDCHLLSALLR